MILKSILTNLNIEKLFRISDQQNIFCLVKDLIFKLNRKVDKGERNDKMAHTSKSKA